MTMKIHDFIWLNRLINVSLPTQLQVLPDVNMKALHYSGWILKEHLKSQLLDKEMRHLLLVQCFFYFQVCFIKWFVTTPSSSRFWKPTFTLMKRKQVWASAAAAEMAWVPYTSISTSFSSFLTFPAFNVISFHVSVSTYLTSRLLKKVKC